jgi:hypothetical protein
MQDRDLNPLMKYIMSVSSGRCGVYESLVQKKTVTQEKRSSTS